MFPLMQNQIGQVDETITDRVIDAVAICSLPIWQVMYFPDIFQNNKETSPRADSLGKKWALTTVHG